MSTSEGQENKSWPNYVGQGGSNESQKDPEKTPLRSLTETRENFQVMMEKIRKKYGYSKNSRSKDTAQKEVNKEFSSGQSKPEIQIGPAQNNILQKTLKLRFPTSNITPTFGNHNSEVQGQDNQAENFNQRRLEFSYDVGDSSHNIPYNDNYLNPGLKLVKQNEFSHHS